MRLQAGRARIELVEGDLTRAMAAEAE